MFLFGFGQASSLLARFAAADVSTADQQGRAIGLIVGGATAGSIIGPNLMALATTLAVNLGLPAAGGPFLIGIGGFGLAALLIEALLRRIRSRSRTTSTTDDARGMVRRAVRRSGHHGHVASGSPSGR